MATTTAGTDAGADAGPADAGRDGGLRFDAGPVCDPACPATELCCVLADGSPACIDPMSDEAHCGACDVACDDGPRGTSCELGRCVCGAVESGCAGTRNSICCPPRDDRGLPYCANLDTDGEDCGACGVSCDPLAADTCTAGRCFCGVDLESCDGSPESQCCADVTGFSRCADTTSERVHCGGCGKRCALGERCEDLPLHPRGHHLSRRMPGRGGLLRRHLLQPFRLQRRDLRRAAGWGPSRRGWDRRGSERRGSQRRGTHALGWGRRRGSERRRSGRRQLMEEVRYLIVGAGISGLAFADWIQDEDYLVCEADDAIGGYCKTVRKEGFVWDYSGHFFHFRRPEIEKYLVDRMSDQEILVVEKDSRIWWDGSYVDFPFQKNIHQLPQGGLYRLPPRSLPSRRARSSMTR